MSRRWRIGLALVATPALLAGGIALALANATLPVKSIAEVLPDDVVLFVRAPALGARWQQLRQHPSYQDLEHSRLVQSLLALDDHGFERLLAERAERLGLAPGLDTYLKFIGRDLGFGIRVDRETGRPSWISAYRVDTPALLQALAVDNPAALARVLTERYFGEGSVPAIASYGGFEIYALGASEPGGEDARSYYALLRDVFVASDARETIERAIDHANAAGAGSLGRRESYAAELARLPEDAVLQLWLDLERVRSGELLAQLGGRRYTGRLHAVLGRTLKPVPALAAALLVPGGDLYAAGLASSRSADELLVDTASPPLRALVPAQGRALYFEMADLRPLVQQFARSPLWQRIRQAQWYRELAGALDQPERLADMFDLELELPPVPEGMELHTRLERRLLWKALSGALDALAPGAVALSLDAPQASAPVPEWFRAMLQGTDLQIDERLGARDVPVFTVAVKLPPLLQLAEAIAMAVLAEQAAQDQEYAEAYVHLAGVRPLAVLVNRRFSWDEESGQMHTSLAPAAAIVRLGDTLLVTTDCTAAAELAQADASALGAGWQEPALPAGYWSLFRFDYARYLEMLRGAVRGPEAEPLRALTDLFTGDVAVSANYIRDGFTTFESVSLTDFGSEPNTAVQGLYLQPAGPFAGWRLLPADTVLDVSWRFEPQALWQLVRRFVPASEQPELEAALAEFHQNTGIDVEQELIPALGGELTLSAAPQALPAGAPEGAVAVPAFTLTWTLDEPQVVERALLALLEAVAPAPPPEATERERARMPRHLELQAAGGVTVHVVEPPAREGVVEKTGGTLRPAFAILPGGMLIASSSTEAVLGAAARAAGAAGGGQPPRSLADSPRRARAQQALGGASSASVHVDLAGLARLAGEYAPVLAPAFAGTAPLAPRAPRVARPRRRHGGVPARPGGIPAGRARVAGRARGGGRQHHPGDQRRAGPVAGLRGHGLGPRRGRQGLVPLGAEAARGLSRRRPARQRPRTGAAALRGGPAVV
ncbi:MAG: hypothetical protein KatS3mg102_0628 [Planctomycetota bacterium]|nr:MAG: hypothetical protein KatS3mg102_0628 [Planctomycetota bacterium]